MLALLISTRPLVSALPSSLSLLLSELSVAGALLLDLGILIVRAVLFLGVAERLLEISERLRVVEAIVTTYDMSYIYIPTYWQERRVFSIGGCLRLRRKVRSSVVSNTFRSFELLLAMIGFRNRVSCGQGASGYSSLFKLVSFLS